MRRVIIRIVAFFLLIGVLGCGHPSGKLVGAWEMEFPASVSSGPWTEDGRTGGKPVKIITETHFAFGSTGANGRMYAGGGRYTLDDDMYTEIIEYHFNPIFIGKKVSFTCRVDGERWYHSGIFEAEGERFNIEEIWRRIE